VVSNVLKRSADCNLEAVTGPVAVPHNAADAALARSINVDPLFAPRCSQRGFCGASVAPSAAGRDVKLKSPRGMQQAKY